MSPIRVLPIAERHVDAVVAIHAAAFRQPDVDEAAQLARSRAHVNDERARPFAPFFVAEDANGIVLGYSLVWLVVDEVHLLEIAVEKAARRSGVGRLLADHVVAAARGRAPRIHRILLEVRRGNTPALALYDRLGFVVYHERRGYYPDGEDALEMELVLGDS